MRAAVDELVHFLEMFGTSGPHPILWVGEDASAAAGYPTSDELLGVLRQHMPGSTKTDFEMINELVAMQGATTLENELETLLGPQRTPIGMHMSMARLAGAGCFAAIFTTNPDETIEDALKRAGVRFVPQILEENFRLQARAELSVIKVHGSRTAWAQAIVGGDRHQRFRHMYPLLHNQLDLVRRTHPILFVGCSMKDPRILDWLRDMPENDRRRLFASRVLMTHDGWGMMQPEEQALLASANITPILVETYADIDAVLADVTRRLAPLPVRDLVFTITPTGNTWTIVGPTPEHAAHIASSPLCDTDFLDQLGRFRDLASLPVAHGSPEALAQQGFLDDLAHTLGAHLTATLLSDQARTDVVTRLHAVDRGRARLTIGVTDTTPESDDALALPWELLFFESGDFPLHAGKIDLVREALVANAPELPEANGPLVLAVSIAAPEDATALRYEDEAYRLQRSLEALGHDVAFADLGDVDDLVRVADAVEPCAIHFSGHGLPGALVFENELGLAITIPIDDIVKRLHIKLGSKAGQFPRFFYLASCHGAAGSGHKTPECRADATHEERCAHERDKVLGKGPSTAATLHRNGFVQVLGYFGPISDPLSTRAEEAFYTAVAAGKTTLQSVAEARATLSEPIALGDLKAHFPFAWTQLALYHRGADRPLAIPGQPSIVSAAVRLQREEIQVSGLPLLKHGFIGRRSTLHRIRRRLNEGQRFFVIQGLGGLGKTALATHLLARVLAPDPADQLILTCGGIDAKMDAAGTLWRQVEDHAERHRVPGWQTKARALREEQPESVDGFVRAVALLRENRPSMVVYADNLESLQEGPQGNDAATLGSWSAAGKPILEALEQLSANGYVLITTRYGWKGLREKAWIRIDPMRKADMLRMIETWPYLSALSRSVQARIAAQVDGHPRTVELLESLVGDRLEDLGPGYHVQDAWVELIEPLLPATAEQVTENLLLTALWGKLSKGAQRHAGGMSVLRRPAPRPVLDALGDRSTTAELIRAGIVTQCPELIINAKGGVDWIDLWGMHRTVRQFVATWSSEDERREAHRKAGMAYAEWTEGPKVRVAEGIEGISHLHLIEEGDRAWPMVHRHVGWLLDTAQFREAKALLEACERVRTTGANLAEAHALLGQIRLVLGERSEALAALLDRAFSLANSDEVRAMAKNSTGRLLRELGKHEEAEAQHRQALAFAQTTTTRIAAKQDLAIVLRRMERYKESETLLRECLASAPPNKANATLLNELAMVLRASGKADMAEDMARRAVSAAEREFGPKHPQRGVALHTLADALQARGSLKDAISTYHQSLAAKEEILGIDHPDLCSTLTSLAFLFFTIDQDVDAEALLERGLNISLQANPGHHPMTAHILGLLAQVQLKLGRMDAARTAQRALTSISALPDHPYGKRVSPTLRTIASGALPPAEAGRLEDYFSARVQQAIDAMQAGDHLRTIEILMPLLEREHAVSDSSLQAGARHLLALAFALSGHLDEAIAHARLGLAYVTKKQDEIQAHMFHEMIADLKRGRYWTEPRIQAALKRYAAGDAPGAIRDLEQMAHQSEHMNAAAPEVSARIALAEILVAIGQSFLASIQLRAALPLAEHLGDQTIVAQIRARLKALETAP